MSLTKATYSMVQGAPFNVLDYGAVGNGTTDDTTAIQAAIDAAAVNGGLVYIPPTLAGYNVTTLTMKARVHVMGGGIRTTFIRQTGAGGGSAFYFPPGTLYATVSDCSIVLTAGTSSEQSGVHFKCLEGFPNSYNQAYNIEVIGGGRHNDQYGIWLDGRTSTNTQVTFIHVYNVYIQNVTRPVYLHPLTEANKFSQVLIDTYGLDGAVNGAGVYIGGYSNLMQDFWFGRGVSTTTSLIGFFVEGWYNRCMGNADVGVGFLVTDTGVRPNFYAGNVLGSTAFTDSNATANIVELGTFQPDSIKSTYRVNCSMLNETNIDMAQFNVPGFTNGFSVKKIGLGMQYLFDDGAVGLPQLTTTQRNALTSLRNGMLIYNTTTDKIQARAASAWVDLN